ncbi:hypothetical protein Lgra_0758 [Legionella gratiana]|uniref:Glycosyltransferase RgtA/B/C/D-like domain-containing protein n=1 Tax=Legionella gratiana TaxID=45066 RepID=A0A378JFN9_9GAMM|nr:hypothetical protein [Legionella gratiana]KTD14148.1 hypothetical protein Lgra_0758 [Legionella gratiana]STX46279.1 Uncharacterised protein [Legionella gratiana]
MSIRLQLRNLMTNHPIAVTFIIIAVFVRLIFWFYTERIWEDALITLTSARNGWLGYGLTHHISEPYIQSFTSPVGVFIALIGETFHQGLFLLRITSLAAAVGSIYYAYRIGQLLNFNRAGQILVLGYLATDQLQIFFGMAGMETQVATMIFIATVFYFFKEEWVILGFLAGIGMLTRPEFVFWLPILGVGIICSSSKKAYFSLISFSCVVLPWMFFAYFYYGSIVPNTIVAKSLSGNIGPFKNSLPTVIDYFLNSWKSIAPFKEWFFTTQEPLSSSIIMFVVMTVIILAILGILKACLIREWKLLGVAIVLLTFIAYRSSATLPTYFMWYLPPFVALLFLLAGYGLSGITFQQTRYYQVGAIVLGSFIAIVYASHIPFSFPVEKRVQNQIERGVRLKTGELLGSMMGPSDTAVLEPLGYMGFGAFNKTIYDHPGLASKVSVDALALSPNKGFGDLIQLLKPSFIVLRPKEFISFSMYHPETAKDYSLVTEIKTKPGLNLKQWGYESNIYMVDSDFSIYRLKDPRTATSAQSAQQKKLDRTRNTSISHLFKTDTILNEVSEERVSFAKYCAGYIDMINGAPSTTSFVVDNNLLKVQGWLVKSTRTKAELPESVLLVLTDNKGKNIFIQTKSMQRPDIGVSFKDSKLDASGYTSIADVSAIRGKYTLGLAYTEKRNIKICPQFKIAGFFKRNPS